MTNNIHPTACINPNAIVGKNVTIGPFAVIEDNVELGENCIVGAHAVIQPYVKLGKNNTIHPHVVLGDLPQDLGFNKETVSWLKIRDYNVFREGFTAHRSTVENGATLINSDCYFMNNSHVAHDCKVGDKTIFANNVVIGGHVEVGNNVFIGGNSAIHQFCRIGSFAIIRGTTGVSKDIIPFMMAGGWPVKHFRLNTIGIKRAGITGERYKVLSTAFRLLRKKESLDTLEQTEEIMYLQTWLAAKSKRGSLGFINL
jgi:UDP-N-acetylglucosamine acyltransferase